MPPAIGLSYCSFPLPSPVLPGTGTLPCLSYVWCEGAPPTGLVRRSTICRGRAHAWEWEQGTDWRLNFSLPAPDAITIRSLGLSRGELAGRLSSPPAGQVREWGRVKGWLTSLLPLGSSPGWSLFPPRVGPPWGGHHFWVCLTPVLTPVRTAAVSFSSLVSCQAP